MFEWNRSVQKMLDCVEDKLTGPLTLEELAAELNYSRWYCTRQFHRYAGISLRNYIRLRRVSLAVIDLRDTSSRIIDIAVKYGFSSQESFTRSFKRVYGITPGQYRKSPGPLPLRVKPNVFEPNQYGLMEENMEEDMSGNITVTIQLIPVHKFIGVVHMGVGGYWDFWKKDEELSGRDRCEEIDGILTSMKSRTDFNGARIVRDGEEGYIYGVEVAADYTGEIPEGMECLIVPETECAVFHHPPYDYVKQEKAVDAAFDKVIGNWDPGKHGYKWDYSNPQGGRHNPPDFGQERIRPLKKVT
ncbi:MAG: AraC family transcriptional regulator [Dehalococcoidales bacterium]|nr:AraC family transcriptional regulator [Dehalococcoidales bacterium]